MDSDSDRDTPSHDLCPSLLPTRKIQNNFGRLACPHAQICHLIDICIKEILDIGCMSIFGSIAQNDSQSENFMVSLIKRSVRIHISAGGPL